MHLTQHRKSQQMLPLSLVSDTILWHFQQGLIMIHLDGTHAAAGPLQRAKNKPMLRIPLRNSFLVLQFDTLEDRDAVVDTLTPLAQQVQNKGKQPAVSDQFSGPPALVAIKKKLLSSDR
jgi:hypothetical protein